MNSSLALFLPASASDVTAAAAAASASVCEPVICSKEGGRRGERSPTEAAGVEEPADSERGKRRRRGAREGEEGGKKQVTQETDGEKLRGKGKLIEA